MNNPKKSGGRALGSSGGAVGVESRRPRALSVGLEAGSQGLWACQSRQLRRGRAGRAAGGRGLSRYGLGPSRASPSFTVAGPYGNASPRIFLAVSTWRRRFAPSTLRNPPRSRLRAEPGHP